MATAFHGVDGRHALPARGLGLLARLTTTVWPGLMRLQARRHAELAQLPAEYWFWLD